MTTKKARSRRLVSSEEYTRDAAYIAKSGEMRTFIYEPYHGLSAFWKASLWTVSNKAPKWQHRCTIFARTRLALHDAILRAGWPSPWREL